MDIETGFASVNGTQLYYESAGSGQDLIFIHGFGLDRRIWDDQFEKFSQQYRVLRYDLRGFGKSSETPTEPYAHHIDLRELMIHLGISKAHIAGLSMGGRIAIDFALIYPQLIASLITVDSVIHGYKFQAFSQYAAASEAKDTGIAAANRKWLYHDLFRPALEKPDVARRLKEIVSSYSGWHWLNKNPWTPLDPPAVQRLSSIAAPTLIVVGERDLPDFHAIGDLLHQEIAHSQKVVIPGVGHMSNMEDPAAFNRVLMDFLATV
jgi:pimeloyl-ACP methyl ester carboxylesterase